MRAESHFESTLIMGRSQVEPMYNEFSFYCENLSDSANKLGPLANWRALLWETNPFYGNSPLIPINFFHRSFFISLQISFWVSTNPNIDQTVHWSESTMIIHEKMSQLTISSELIEIWFRIHEQRNESIHIPQFICNEMNVLIKSICEWSTDVYLYLRGLETLHFLASLGLWKLDHHEQHSYQNSVRNHLK